MKKNKGAFRFCRFSPKQLRIMNWWLDNSPYADFDGVIADGAIRSGKTLSMSLSFVMWATQNFSIAHITKESDILMVLPERIAPSAITPS